MLHFPNSLAVFFNLPFHKILTVFGVAKPVPPCHIIRVLQTSEQINIILSVLAILFQKGQQLLTVGLDYFSGGKTICLFHTHMKICW